MENSKKLAVDCIIPAAGLSSRMGQWKLMLPYNGKSIIEQCIDNALAVCSRVILVTGYNAVELEARYNNHPSVTVIRNEEYSSGMVSSVRIGVTQVQTDYFFITHADMPCITDDVFIKLWLARIDGSVFPGNESRSGHPVLLSASLRTAILNDRNSPSIKSILKRFSAAYLDLSDSSIHLDIDTPQAYQGLIDR